MKYRWFTLDTYGLKVNQAYIGSDSNEYGGVMDFKGKLIAFACNGKFKRSMFPATVNEGRIYVQKQFDVRVPK